MREQLAGDIVWLGGGLLYGWLICALAQLAALGPARACRAAASVRGRTGCALCKLPPREYSAAAAICFALLLIVPPGVHTPDRALVINLRDEAVAGTFERVLEVVPDDETRRAGSRERWKTYKAAGIEPVKHDM